MNLNDKKTEIADSIYKNKSKLMRYFICAIVLGAARYVLSALAQFAFSISASDGQLIGWIVWSILFFPAVKLFAFKNRCKHIYALMTQIMFYILGIFAVWLANGILTGVLYIVTSSAQASTMLGGGISEILCLIIMNRIFRK